MGSLPSAVWPGCCYDREQSVITILVMIFLYLSLSALCLALSLGNFELLLSSHVTAWAGDTVIINCTVHTENNSSAVIIWLREQDNRSEVVAHHDKILLTEQEDDAKFQVLVRSELSERSVVVSQLSIQDSRVEDSATFTCVVTDS